MWSRGLGTVPLVFLGAGTLAAQPVPDPAGISAALDRARPHMLEDVAATAAGPRALLCLALLHDEVPRDHPVLAAALRALAAEQLGGTYELALRLLVMAEAPDFPRREELAPRDTKHLLRNQTGGGFGYGPNSERWDLSNTQYAALGLRAAVSLGCEVPQKVWKTLLRAVERAQTPSGGFGYLTADDTPSVSMTAAGIAVLEICLVNLGDKDVPVEKVQKRLQRAWSWMAKQRESIGDPHVTWCFYFHYGLERAAILSGLERVGEVDWYAAGAKMLLQTELPSGGWSAHMIAFPTRLERSPGMRPDPVSTAFAVLFLRRKFQRSLGPVTDPGGYLTRGLPATATEAEVARAVELDVGRGLRAVPDLLVSMRSELLPQRKAAAIAIERITGQDFGYSPYRDEAENAEAIKSAERWWLTEGRSAARAVK
jgi:hypothetical protein